MQKVRMYVNGCTRKIRFNNVTALNNYLSSQTPLELEIEGCVITDATGYFDFKAPLNGMSLALSTYSYVVIELNDGAYENSNYYAFIDKIDINNFNNQEGNYYRCYFTIDWWTTIGLTTNEIKKSLEGEVVRAHILDINNSWHPNLAYTLDDPEIEVDKYIRSSTKVNGEQKWLYVFSTKPTFGEDNYASSPSFIIGDKKIASSICCYLSHIKLDKITEPTITAKYIINAFSGPLGAPVPTQEHYERDLNGVPTADALSDSSIVSIYITDYLPFEYEEENGRITSILLTEESGFNTWYQVDEELNMTNFAGVTGDLVDVGAPILKDIPSKQLNANDFNIKLRGNTEFRKPQTYEEYLENNISKSFFAPYNYTSLEKNGKRVIIDTAYIDSDYICEYNICPMISGYVVYAPSTRKVGEAAYSVIEDSSAYERTSTNDNFTKLSAMSSSIGWLGKTLTGVALGATIGMTGGAGALARAGVATAGALTGAVSSGISEHSKWNKTLRDGEDGTKIVSGASSDYISPLQLVSTKVFDSEMLKVRKDLALYGYNTYLHPHEVFEEKHLRKYFNYIKTVDCDVAIPLLNESVRKDIESMFNNGVWLWNTDEEFGNFEVPNYPLIMEV